MKRLAIPFSLFLFSLGFGALASGCGGPTIEGSGTMSTRTHSVSGFEHVISCCGFEVELVEGANEGVFVSADDNIASDVLAVRKGENLELRWADPTATYYPSQPVHIVITTENVTSFLGSNGTKLTAEAINANTFELILSGGGSATIRGGKVDSQNVELSGGSVYEAGDLESTRATLDLSGGSRATVWVKEELTVEASGTSVVKYKGGPSLDETLSGGSYTEPID